MIGRLRRALSTAFHRGTPGRSPATRQRLDDEVDRRIEAAQRRLKATIPPPGE